MRRSKRRIPRFHSGFSSFLFLVFLLRRVLDQGRGRRREDNMRRSKRRIANKNAASGITALPNHIMCDILSRLPLNSIFTCKRVCKTWRNLTLETYFAKSHLSRSPFSLVSYRRGTNESSPFHFRILQLHDPIDFNNCTTMNFTSTGTYFPRTRTNMVASCNGLFLLASFPPSRELVVACNPLRAQHLILPTPPEKPHMFERGPVGFGIGQSAVTDRYKVVRFTSTVVPARLDVDVYTLGIDTKWRSIEDAACLPSVFISELVFLNGALHWIGLEDSWLICYFNIEKEQFGSFPLPAHIGDDCGCLSVINNCLCIYKSPFAHFAVNNLWMMKDYRDFGSWTLECVVELWNVFPHGFRGFLKPLKLLKDGSLLMSVQVTKGMDRPIKNKITLASYDPQTRLLKKMKYRGSLFLDTPHACVPCFFSPMDALK